MKRAIVLAICNLLFLVFVHASTERDSGTGLTFFPATNPNIQYVGRIDFSNPSLPRFWQPGVYITIQFSGPTCEVILNDEVLWGSSHNYIEIILDGKAERLRLNNKTDTFRLVPPLKKSSHKLVIVKNTEANIGYLELVGFRCNKLIQPASLPDRRIEFIGNSITCGTGSDQSAIPCGTGVWQDQHNAYLSYGSITARALKAQHHLSAVSGIGLLHSCCGMDIIMPQVYDKISMRNNAIPWNFNNYHPDVITVCLGQNDGLQDSASFCNNYISFIAQLRSYHPQAAIICLTSPMADASLRSFMEKSLTAIRTSINNAGDKKVFTYFFRKQYHHGCDSHPNLAEHSEIADELKASIAEIMNWK
jgi:lysophospholipase L1-like esterase